MTRKEALTKLLEKVADQPTVMQPWYFQDALNGGDHINCAGQAYEAYHGSLDAAMDLHEAVLPGWLWRQQYNGKIHTHTTHGKIMAGQFSEAEHPDNPARAWLIAILKALIAQEPKA